MQPLKQPQSKDLRGVDVDIVSLTKTFDRTRVLDNVTLSVAKGEFFTLLGPSGCGKTTILRSIAGFSDIDSGSIQFNGLEISKIPPWQRNIGFVFQNYALWPNRTVFDNVAFGLRLRKIPNDRICEKVSEILELVEMKGSERRFPAELSGGMQQRTAIARALVIEPNLLLLDEPLSNLDAKLRVSLRREIQTIQKRLSVTTIYVTHDQEEALEISDRVAVMNDGKVQQIGRAEEIYGQPRSRFVAEFVGAINLIEGVFTKAGVFTIRDGPSFSWPEAEKQGWCGAGHLAIRPEDMTVVKKEGGQHLDGEITQCYYLGAQRRYEVTGATAKPVFFTSRELLSVREKVQLRVERAVWLPQVPS